MPPSARRRRTRSPGRAWRGDGIAAALLGLLSASGPGLAEPLPTATEDLKSWVAGKAIDLDTPLGSPISITYKPNGTLAAKAGSALTLFLGSATDRGRWWVANGRLCQKFFAWLEGETSCLKLRQDGRRIHWTRDDGKTGTATILASAAGGAQQPSGLGVPMPLRQPPPADRASDPDRGAPAERTGRPEQTLAMVRVEPDGDDEPSARPPAAQLALAPGREIAALVPLPPPPAPVPVQQPLRLVEPQRLVEPLRLVEVAAAAMVPAFTHTARTTSQAWSAPHDWPVDGPNTEQTTRVRAMVAEARQASMQVRWCHDVRDVRLLVRPPAANATAPELMTATRHIHADQPADLTGASCLVPAPPLFDVARQLEATR